MNKTILKLSLICALLFVLSVVTYKWDNYRGVDLIAGAELINTLDIDKVHRFSIKGKSGEQLNFLRRGDSFILENFSNYPVKGPQISELIYKLSSITVKEKVRGAQFSKYGVDKKEANFDLSFFDDKGKELLGLYVGKSYKGKGHYVRRAGGEQIYLTERPVEISLDKSSFIEQNILDFEKDNLEKLDLNGEVVIVKDNQGWGIEGLDKSKYSGENIEEAVENLQKVEFDDFFHASDAKVSNLKFNRGANIFLNNKMIYKLALARDKNRYFLKAHATLAEIPEDIVLNPQGGNENLKAVNDMIKVQSGAQNFNLRFKNWVFEISEYEYNKFIKDKLNI
ncbi:MAG: DUF4340 domain-containing protein [Deltaproteobacteria bacterium]|nr:MAG: DUF4340 domain-containing protein [Deltaproteobacteria bacterium]